MRTLIYTVGLPGSGKSTWAKKMLNTEVGKFKRVNRDDLRAMLDDSRWSKQNEKLITTIQDNIIREALISGYSVICDDTNLKDPEERFKKIIKSTGLSVRLIKEDFTSVSVEECIKRDLKRLNSVGKDVIMRMFNQHLSKPIELLKQDETLPQVYLCDLDGTVALMNGRSPFDWKRVGEDLPNKHVVDTVKKVMQHTPVIFMSGRDEVCREESRQWISEVFELSNSEFELYMRPKGDQRKDSIIKKELFDKYIRDKYYVIGVFDDRDQVVETWRREIRLTVFQVAYGDF